MREYKILSETVAHTLEEQIKAMHLEHRDMKVEGFIFDGTNYVALVSFEMS